MNENYCLGIDIGATKIKIGAVNRSGEIFQLEKIPTEAESGHEKIIEKVIEVAKNFAKQFKFIGIGIGIAGQINPETGSVIFAPNLKWKDVPIGPNISDKLNLPVKLIDDVKAATLAEGKFGSGKGSSNFVCLFLGTGIGGGIFINGKLYDGTSNTAGEFGHMIIDFQGPKCSCGNWGCLEAYAGGWALAKNAKSAVEKNPKLGAYLLNKAGSIDQITGKTITEAAKEGDSLSEEIITQAQEALVAGCVNIVNGLNPERIIIGGGVSEGIPNLLSYLKIGIYQRALSAASSKFHIMKAHLGNDAVVVGATLLFFEKN